MRQGWKWRGTLQGDLPELPASPEGADGEVLLEATGRYDGSTSAGQWLDRIVAHGLGTRSRAVLTLTEAGVDVERPGARDFFIPADRLRGARLEKGIAGKVLTEGGLLAITGSTGAGPTPVSASTEPRSTPCGRSGSTTWPATKASPARTTTQ